MGASLVDSADIGRLKSDRGRLIEALEAAGARIRGNAVHCPFHDDKNPSGGIYEGDGAWRFTCHAECDWSGDVFDVIRKSHRCDFAAACAVLGVSSDRPRVVDSAQPIKSTAGTPKNGRGEPGRTFRAPDVAVVWMLTWPKFRGGSHTASWTYHYVDGRTAFIVARFDFEDGSKQFRPIRPEGDRWAIGDPPGPLPLYLLPELSSTGRVWVCEGERCVHVARGIGFDATTSSHGAKSAKRTDWTLLANRDVVILPDNDAAGRAYANDVAQILRDLGCTVRIVELPGLPEGGDVVDFITSKDSTDSEDIRRGIEELADAAPEITAEPTRHTITYRCTDLGNAERFAAMHGQSVRYCHPWGKWLMWTGTHWAQDDSGEIDRKTIKTLRSIYEEAARCEDGDKRSAISKWAVSCESDAKIRATVSLARSQPSIPVLPKQLDADAWLFNVRNGTINLRTGEMKPHDPADLITKTAPVEFDPKAQCPRFLAFHDHIMDSDEDRMEFNQRFFGLCLTGDIREQVLIIAHGSGANGKSTLLDCLCGLMGAYAATAPPDLLTQRRHEEHPTSIADLCGKRLVVAEETEERRRLKVSFVKQITGSPKLKGRRMREDYTEFDRTFKLVLVTNNLPKITESSHAIWRRIRLIPFGVVIPDDHMDRDLPAKLKAEWPGVLAWAVRGCVAWQRDGLPIVDAITVATAEYRSEEDVLGPFLDERCIVDPEQRVTRKALWDVYQDWGKNSGERATLDRTGLYERLRQKGFEDDRFRVSGRLQRGFKGLCAVVQ